MTDWQTSQGGLHMRDASATSIDQNRLATVVAQPGPMQFALGRAAVLVIDMQNDFGSAGGMFHRAGIDISMIQRAVEPTRQVLQAARAQGIPVVYLKMAFKADMSDAGPVASPNFARHQRLSAGMPVQAPDGSASRILIRDTWNTDLLPALAAEDADVVLYKHRFSGFFETDLDALLKQRGITHLIVTGCTTSICVDSTIRDAMFRDYQCLLLEDCTGEPIGHDLARSNHEASLLTVQVLLGWTSTSAHFIAALEAVGA
jgi:ureidoacrylate peracid hydrolase